jgi:hypothetical protein
MSFISIWSREPFNSDASLLIFYLDDLSIAKSWVLKFTPIAVLESIFPFRSFNTLYI